MSLLSNGVTPQKATESHKVLGNILSAGMLPTETVRDRKSVK